MSDRGRKSVQRLVSVWKRDIVRQRKEECIKVGFNREERHCQTEEGKVYKGWFQQGREFLSDRGRKSVEVGFSREERHCQT